MSNERIECGNVTSSHEGQHSALNIREEVQMAVAHGKGVPHWTSALTNSDWPATQPSIFSSPSPALLSSPLPPELSLNRVTLHGYDCRPVQLLDQYRNNRLLSLQLKDVAGCAICFARDQVGSRFLQERLEQAREDERETVFAEMCPHLCELMTDVFGNYVVQKFLEWGTHSQRERVGMALRGKVLRMTMHMYGCRVVQKAVECIHLQNDIAIELQGHIIRCVKDQNGNHVIQKCIQCFPNPDFILHSFRGQVLQLATHSYGCRVIQRVLEHYPETPLLQELLLHTESLIQDQYGNYVVQHLLPQHCAQVVSVLRGRLVHFSKHKFASNVVEKCIIHSSERAQLIEEIVSDQSGFSTLLRHQFGNYVVQKMLETADEFYLSLMVSRIRAQENVLKKYTCGKHVLAKLDKLL